MLELFALVAFAISDSQVPFPASQTLGYYATIADCQRDKNFIEDKNGYNRSYVWLDCVPIKVSE